MLVSSPSSGQEPGGTGSTSTYQWRADASMVQQATFAELTPIDDGKVADAGGPTLPPIVSPNQAKPGWNSSMLAPIETSVESEPTNGLPIQNTLAEQPTQQWPMMHGQDPSYRVAQGSGSRNIPVPIQNSPPIQTLPLSTPRADAKPARLNPIPMPSVAEGNPTTAPVLPPEALMPAERYVSASSANVEPTQESESVPPPTPSLEPTVSNYFRPQNGPAPVYNPTTSGVCPSCGGGGCSQCGGVDPSACGSCGPNGCFDQAEVDGRFGCAGAVSGARFYAIADVMSWTRTDNNFGGTSLGRMPNFDNAAAWQITVGRRWDATAGDELVYSGTDTIGRSQAFTDPNGNLDAAFQPGGSFGFAELGSFFNANFQREVQTTEVHSLEYNRVKWSWDVSKTFYGIRFIYVEDNYALVSRTTTLGALTFDARNNLIGPQIGQELFYDVGYRLSFSGLAKVGGYLNLTDFDTQLVNASTVFVNRETNNTEFSMSLDLGATAHYQITPRVRLRFGIVAELLFRMTTTNHNFPPVVSGSLGSNIRNVDEMGFIGYFGGLEMFR